MVADSHAPLAVRNLNIYNSHCQFVATTPALAIGEVHQIVNDTGYSRRVKIEMIQLSGPSHQRLMFVLAKLLDHDDSRQIRVPSRRVPTSRPLPRDARETLGEGIP